MEYNSMPKENCSKYGIDLFEIYENEVNQFHKKKITHQELRAVYYFVKTFFIRSKPEPFLEVSYESNAEYRLDIDRYLKEINKFIEGSGITFCFLHRDKLYEIECDHICILRQDVNSLDFEKLFAYALRTYEDKLSEIYPFLDFQLVNNFEDISRNFHHFLEIVLTQYDNLISDKIEKFVRKWIAENTNNLRNKTNKTDDTEIEQFSEIDEELLTTSLIPIPEEYKIINFRISRINTLLYFSFLYQTKNKLDKSILTKEEFIEIFKYGIAIPPNENKKLFKLNLTDIKKSSIEYAIYNFYAEYSINTSQKKELMHFWGYYFKDFKIKIATPSAIENWNKNLTRRIKPQKMDFIIPNIPANE